MLRSLVLSSLFVALAAPALAQPSLPADFAVETVVAGLDNPVSFRFLPDGRILMAELNTGRVRLAIGGTIAATDPVLTVPNLNNPGSERGLLSLEIDAQWPSRPFLYVYYTALELPPAQVRVTRFKAMGDLDGSGDGIVSYDAASALHLLPAIRDDRSNHNGGEVRFGPDGMLYVSIGDDETGQCSAQDLNSQLGKVLRLRVDHLAVDRTGTVALSELAPLAPNENPFDGQGDVASLVWAYGLRNPVRFHIDSTDGSLFVADVGKDKWEEVSHIEGPGENLGWPWREGLVSFTPQYENCVEPVDFESQHLRPIDAYQYNGHASTLSVISGALYRGVPGGEGSFPAAYEGDYFYIDHYKGDLVRMSGAGQSWSVAASVPGQGNPAYWATGLGRTASYDVGPDGALYYLDYSGGRLARIYSTISAPGSTSSVGRLKAGFGTTDN